MPASDRAAGPVSLAPSGVARSAATASAPRFAILASGRGSNADVLMQAFASGAIRADLVGVVTNVEGAGVLEHAARHGVATHTVVHRGLARESHESAVIDVLTELGAQHVLLAGYMRVLSPAFLSRFSGRILNIHPSLLPEFPGLHAAERQWQARRSVAGATVHFVDGGVDTGPVILQGSIDVRGDEGPDGLAQRILTEVEHVIYPRAVRLFVERLTQPPPSEATQETP